MFDVTEEYAGGELVLNKGEGIALIELNRPDQFNALTRALLDGLVEVFNALAVDAGIRAIVVTGRGRAFTAGVDLKELENTPELMGSEGLGPDAPLLRAFSDCPKPIIGAVNGFAVTGGLELALACDFLYAADTAKFADTHARVGLLPGWGLSQKLPRLVGINRAREISFSGNYFTAEQAMDWGLVNAVYPQNELLEAALDIAHQISTALPDALYRIKAMMNQGWEMTLGDGLLKEGQVSSDYNSKVEFSAMKERLAQLQQRSRKG
jgi:enoyl-CoA hydratase